MSDDRAAQAIAMTAPRAVDVTAWLILGASPEMNCAILKQFGDVMLHMTLNFKLCGAIFAPAEDHSIPPHFSEQLQYFFKRDGVEACVFEFDKFTRHFTARRLDEVISRTK